MEPYFGFVSKYSLSLVTTKRVFKNFEYKKVCQVWSQNYVQVAVNSSKMEQTVQKRTKYGKNWVQNGANLAKNLLLTLTYLILYLYLVPDCIYGATLFP